MNLLPRMPNVDAAWSAIPIAFLIYVILQIDARRKDSPNAADDQLGIKTVAATLAVVSTLLLAIGLQGFLTAILTFDDFGARLESAMPSVIVGALGVAGTALVLFPRTNASEFPKAKRLAAGVVALVAGIAMLPALAGFLSALFAWPSWKVVAGELAIAVDALVIFAGGFVVLGKLSGLKMPAPTEKPMGPPRGGMQQQGPGMQHPGMQQPAPGMQAPGMQQPPQGYPPAGMQQPPQGYPPAGMQPPQGQPPGGMQPPQGVAPSGGTQVPGQGQGGWPQG